ncbi:MAG: hypothetical protein FWD12_01250, partial [Alphaproteobacteria bacterium]|nr:hypothetical protein [Alphaproteobacteria bacterium]
PRGMGVSRWPASLSAPLRDGRVIAGSAARLHRMQGFGAMFAPCGAALVVEEAKGRSQILCSRLMPG